MFKAIADFTIDMVLFLAGGAILAASVHYSLAEFFPALNLSYLQTFMACAIIGALKLKLSDLVTVANAERSIPPYAFFGVQLYTATLLAVITWILTHLK